MNVSFKEKYKLRINFTIFTYGIIVGWLSVLPLTRNLRCYILRSTIRVVERQTTLLSEMEMYCSRIVISEKIMIDKVWEILFNRVFKNKHKRLCICKDQNLEFNHETRLSLVHILKYFVYALFFSQIRAKFSTSTT